MARLESILFTPHRAAIDNNSIDWKRVEWCPLIPSLPQIFWADGMPWREVNLWVHERATSGTLSIKTLYANAAAMLAYAKWLEESRTSWDDFPIRKADRCIVRYRGALIDARSRGTIAPSTASQRIRVVISFYRWLQQTSPLSDVQTWTEKIVTLRFFNSVGFRRTAAVRTTDLAIPNRKASGEGLEGGLTPLTAVERDSILSLANRIASEELYLFLALGFFTGMRIGTLADLRVETITGAAIDPLCPGLHRLAIGPGATPPVSTKFGVTGQVLIPSALLENVHNYAHSIRRLKREAKAAEENRNLIFLTRFGNPYHRTKSHNNSSFNVEMHGFKNKAVAAGLDASKRFKFHQTRCTFATELAKIALKYVSSINAIAIVKTSLLHKDESTALRYIRFVENTPVKEEAANSFTRAFLGLVTPSTDMNRS